jgi:hypothetical protein
VKEWQLGLAEAYCVLCYTVLWWVAGEYSY